MLPEISVVVTGGSANALGVLRSLPHCDLSLLCDDVDAAAWHSRHGRKVLVASTRGPSVVEDLLQLAQKKPAGYKSVLILTEEKTVVHVSAARAQLEPYYLFLLCPASLLTDLQSKEGFQRLALAAGSPVPIGIVLKGLQDISETHGLRYPCVLKPLEQDAAYAERFKKAYKVQSAAEMHSLYQAIEPVMPRMIVQEWLEGADSDIYFCLGFYDASSNLVGSAFTGRKIRSWPLEVGGTASCTSAPEHAEILTQLTSDFVRAVGYVGQIGMEFKKDSHRGGFFMVEPTVGRTDYQHEIAALSGINVLAMMVAYLSGHPVPEYAEAQRQLVWFDEFADANALEHGAQNDLFRDRAKVAAIWRINDPMPTIADIWRRLKSRL